MKSDNKIIIGSGLAGPLLAIYLGLRNYKVKLFERQIDQRKNNLPPKNFESNEDSLDGFDLAEFEPR